MAFGEFFNAEADEVVGYPRGGDVAVAATDPVEKPERWND